MIILKKILIYLLSFILIIFIIPALLTKRTTSTSSKQETENQLQVNNQEKQTTENQTETSNKNTYNYNKYGTISLLHKKNGEVEQVNLDDYLCNVVSAEMSNPETLRLGTLIPLTKHTVDHSEKFDKFAASQLSIA